MSTLEELNPRAKKVKVGTRQLKEVNLYPLSAGDQFEMLDVIKEAFIKFTSLPEDQQTRAKMIEAVTNLIKENIETILDFVIDPDEWQSLFGDKPIVSCLDNVQLIEVLTIVYEVNFKDAQKKIQEIWGSIQELLPTMEKEETLEQETSLQQSLEGIPNTDLGTSLESDIIKED